MLNTKTYFPSEYEWAYLAGLFDGEGCIKVKLNKRTDTKRKAIAWQMTLDLRNTHYPTVNWIVETFGGSVHSQERKNKNHRRIFVWSVWSSAKMTKILSEMLPFLHIKKEQAQLALSFLTTVRLRGPKKLTPEELSQRETLCLALRKSRHFEYPPIQRAA